MLHSRDECSGFIPTQSTEALTGDTDVKQDQQLWTETDEKNTHTHTALGSDGKLWSLKMDLLPPQHVSPSLYVS